MSKRRAATRPTKAGVISQATSIKDSTTITGTASATTISGASTTWKPAAPTESSHCRKLTTSDHCSSAARTPATAASQ